MTAASPQKTDKFQRLVRRKLVTDNELRAMIAQANPSGAFVEDLLLAHGVPKHEILFSLAEYYGDPYVEYDEETFISPRVARHVDLNRLKQAMWAPLSLDREGGRATVIACNRDDPVLLEDIKQTLGVETVDFLIALPHDLVRIIENSQDINPGFAPESGRTAQAKVRNALGEQRSILACHRTALARARTGLALLRTGLSFVAIALLLLRLFGLGYGIIPETALLLTGLMFVAKGFAWYLPARNEAGVMSTCRYPTATESGAGLTVSVSNSQPVFGRTAPVPGAEMLRRDWANLSPVMRRRFLASDRTDMAGERTMLACLRTVMARARTGLAFARTGVALVGLGIALMRQFPLGIWYFFDLGLVVVGVAVAMEGFHWYLPGRNAGTRGLDAIHEAEGRLTIWDMVLPPRHKLNEPWSAHVTIPLLRAAHDPGIWGTTGLALERTFLAERRNLMARLRTIMARSRTGLAFVRTGIGISAVGLGLLIFFGADSILWTGFETLLVLFGLALVGDGLHWHLPAERIRRQYPYCFGNFEIILPDYGTPAHHWGHAVFDHE